MKDIILTLILIAIFSFISENVPGFGRLPGDFEIQYKNITIYLPLVSCALLALICSVIWTFAGRHP